MYKKPELDPRFFYGQILRYEFLGGITKDRGKYRFRLKIFYSTGQEVVTQKSGFLKKKDAERAKEQIIHDLINGTFCPFSFTLQQVIEYWLYSYCIEERKIAYNTFISYRNVCYNHILTGIKGDIKIHTVTSVQLQRFLKKFDSHSTRKNVIKALRGIFQLAKDRHYIDFDPVPVAVKNVHQIKPLSPKKREVSWTLDQIKYALCTCKECFPELYMPLLLSLILGTRISETIALKYSDIDFRNKTLLLTRQLGHYIDKEDGEKKAGEIEPKTSNGYRSIPIPDWVLDEIIVARALYEKNRKMIPGFQDHDYICCRIDGRPYHRGSMHRDYKELLRVCGFEDIRWHDLRHVYASSLKHNGINLKSISEFLGHGSTEMSELYIASEEKVYDCTILEGIWTFVKPCIETGNSCINIQEALIFSLLPQKDPTISNKGL